MRSSSLPTGSTHSSLIAPLDPCRSLCGPLNEKKRVQSKFAHDQWTGAIQPTQQSPLQTGSGQNIEQNTLMSSHETLDSRKRMICGKTLTVYQDRERGLIVEQAGESATSRAGTSSSRARVGRAGRQLSRPQTKALKQKVGGVHRRGVRCGPKSRWGVRHA